MTVFVTSALANTYLANKSNRCGPNQTTHQVVISAGKATPTFTQAKLCEHLTITNNDGQLYLMAFGEHQDHLAYDGVIEKLLAQNESLSVQLVQAGTFVFHDHLQDKVQGVFTVSQ